MKIEEKLKLSTIPIRYINPNLNGKIDHAGSGCFVKYKEGYMFLTVRHVLKGLPSNEKNYNCMIEIEWQSDIQQTALVKIDCVVYTRFMLDDFNKITEEKINNAYQVFHSISSHSKSFINQASIHEAYETLTLLDKMFRSQDKIDFACKKTKYIQCKYQEIDRETNCVIKEENRLPIELDLSIAPSATEIYGFSGSTHNLRDGRYLTTINPIYTGLKYIGEEDNYLVFEFPSGASYQKEDYQGCSGAPILDSQGNLVALVSQLKGTKIKPLLYGINLKKMENLIDIEYNS